MAKKKKAVEADEEPSAPTVFTTINHLSSVRPLKYANLVEQNMPYQKFLINRAFSLSEDTVMAASMMNERSGLDDDIQATFYIHAVRPRKRWEKWPKSISQDTIEIIAQYYGMSKREAKTVAELHTSEHISSMKAFLETGARPSRNIIS